MLLLRQCCDNPMSIFQIKYFGHSKKDLARFISKNYNHLNLCCLPTTGRVSHIFNCFFRIAVNGIIVLIHSDLEEYLRQVES